MSNNKLSPSLIRKRYFYQFKLIGCFLEIHKPSTNILISLQLDDFLEIHDREIRTFAPRKYKMLIDSYSD